MSGPLLPPLEPVLIDDAYFHGFGPPKLRFSMKLDPRRGISLRCLTRGREGVGCL